MDNEIKNPEILQLQEEVNALKQSFAELTSSHNKMFDYLKDKSTQGGDVKRNVTNNKTLKDFIKEKENKK